MEAFARMVCSPSSKTSAAIEEKLESLDKSRIRVNNAREKTETLTVRCEHQLLKESNEGAKRCPFNKEAARNKKVKKIEKYNTISECYSKS